MPGMALWSIPSMDVPVGAAGSLDWVGDGCA
jgi:hypothetical protein